MELEEPQTNNERGVCCPCCGLPVTDGDALVKCGTCDSLHHLECWERAGGCCLPGCPASVIRSREERPSVYEQAPWSQTEPEPTALPSIAHFGSWPWIIAVLVAVIMASVFLSIPIITAVIATTNDPMALLQDPFTLFLVVVVQDVVFVGVVYFLIVRRKVLSWRQMGLGRPRLRSLTSGLLYGAAFIVVATAFEFLLRGFGVEQNQAAQFPLGKGGVLGTAAIWLAGVVLAPVTEEIFFRGFVFRAMAARKGLPRGLIYSSLIFGLVHFNGPAFLPISAGAALLALGYHRTNDLWVPIIAHSLNNLVAFILLTMGGR